MDFISSCTSARGRDAEYRVLKVIEDSELDFYSPGCLHWKLKNSVDLNWMNEMDREWKAPLTCFTGLLQTMITY